MQVSLSDLRSIFLCKGSSKDWTGMEGDKYGQQVAFAALTKGKVGRKQAFNRLYRLDQSFQELNLKKGSLSKVTVASKMGGLPSGADLY